MFIDYEVRFFSENSTLLQKNVSLIDDVIKVGLNYASVAITKQSNYLLVRTMNLVRYALRAEENLDYIYDRSYED